MPERCRYRWALGSGCLLASSDLLKSALLHRSAWVMHCDAAGKCWASRRRPQGHSARVIGEIERGKTTVQLGVVLDYAEFLGVEVRLKAGE